MARSRRRRIVQSNEEYLSEEQTEEENTLQQLATPSEQETICDDSGEGSADTDDDFDINHGEGNEDTDDNVDINDGEGNEHTDVDINVRVENGAPETCGKTKLKDVWNHPKGLKIVVQCNDLNQAVGEEAGILGKFLGMIARNGSLCSLGYTDWRYVIGKREKNTNELKVKKDILKQVKMRFLYAPRMEEFILKKLEKDGGNKAKLKELYFDVNETNEANCNNVPKGVPPNQWIALANHWMNEKSKGGGSPVWIEVPEKSKSAFWELKRRKGHRYVIFKIDYRSEEIIVEKTGPPGESYDDFTASLPADDCRFYDLDFVSDDNCRKSKIFFISWSPSLPRIRAKTIYAVSRNQFRHELDGVRFEIQATDPCFFK